MRRRAYVILSVFIAWGLLIAPLSFAAEKGKHKFLPDIPKTWTQIYPDDVDPDFEYDGLEPSCAACPGCNPQYSFFVKGGKTNNLVIYFQGGGACWDSMNCLYVPTYSQEVPSLAQFDNTTGKGIFDAKNPANPFKDWYFVYIPYCTGDIHWGASDIDYVDFLDMLPTDSWTIRHRGFVNFKLVMQWVEENFQMPFRIFVTGSSAGGYGAIMGFPTIKEAYPDSQVYVLGDAANGIVGEDFQQGSIFNWDIQVPEWIPGFEAGYTPDMEISDVYLNIANYYTDSKLGQFTTAWDWNQTFFYYVMLNINDPSSWETGWPVKWCSWNGQMLDYAYETADGAPNYRYYIAAGDYHTIMMSPKFYTEDSAGVSFAKWVKMMVNNPLNPHWGPPGGKWQNVECTDCLDPLTCP